MKKSHLLGALSAYVFFFITGSIKASLRRLLTAALALLVGTIASSAWALTPTEVAKLLAGDGATGDRFGWTVSVDGDTAVIGASSDDDKGIQSGSAYVFVRTGTTWNQQAKLLASDGAVEDVFGGSVSVDGDTAVIGADGDDDDSGSAYVFVRTGTTWHQQAMLL
ncbi:MAG: FG-GAP repeat protein, partial [Gammaproteobacteria bacterium]